VEALKSYVAITKTILNYLNSLAISNGYNRSLMEWLFNTKGTDDMKAIDGRFPIFLKMAMPHYHIEGVVAPMHYRTVWECVLIGDDDTVNESATVIVDIPAEAYELLPDVPEVQNITDDVMSVWENIKQEEMTENFIKDVEELLSKESEEE
jgi:hypothetical protein